MTSTQSIKAVKHKPTLAPLKCDHCNRIWYGIYCSEETHRIMPHGKILCSECWNALDNYLHKHNYQEWIAVDRKRCQDSIEWKKDYPHFFELATQWIEDAKPRKRHYSHVPKFVRIAIEAGKMEPNDEYVYMVTTCSDRLVKVDKTLDRSGLKHSAGKMYW